MAPHQPHEGRYQAVAATSEHLEVDVDVDVDDSNWNALTESRCVRLRLQLGIASLVFIVVMAANRSPTTTQQRLDDGNNLPTSSTCGARLLWNDEFDRPELDLAKWSYILGDGCDVGLCGWGNHELEVYTQDADNIRIENGRLVIEAHIMANDARSNSSSSENGNGHGDNDDYETASSPSTRRYTSAKIASQRLADFGAVGKRFEASLQLPHGQGIWPAFWMLPSKNRFGGWPKSGEIDIMENIGREGSNTIHGTLHYGPDWPHDQYAEEGIRLDKRAFGNFSESFHVFAAEVGKSDIRFYVDDILYSTKTEKDLFPYHWPFREEFYFIVNLAVGGNWPGYPDESTIFPQQLVVDYIRVYEGRVRGIEGPQLVNNFEKDVNYTILEGKLAAEEALFQYTWSVPDDASIVHGQGTNAIQVSFGKEEGIISVERVPLEDKILQDYDCYEPTRAGIRVKVFSINDKHNTKFGFDCGCPNDCNSYILNRVAGIDYTCGERIKWLIDQDVSEADACKQISVDEFNGHCGACNPDRCKR